MANALETTNGQAKRKQKVEEAANVEDETTGASSEIGDSTPIAKNKVVELNEKHGEKGDTDTEDA